LLDQLNIGLLAFSEMSRQAMYRGQSRTMYRMGQVMEDILMGLTLYQSLLAYEKEENVEFQLLETLLLASQNLSTYRSVYRTHFEIAPAIDLLFFNNLNPTSLISQFEGLLKYARSLPQKDEGTNDSELARLVFESYSHVKLISVSRLTVADEKTGHRKEFDNFCEKLTEQVSLLFTKLSADYFIHSTYQPQGGQEGFKFEV